ncbi:hypothetical protein [Cochleicola gelatinilyticus]|uniref:Adhesin domain-containing protein n=1 Tax=Cochleicola gelatinilyticus TaxID=1763537 RepID=A0A167IXP4_9FLAO|nr:hypothetical protein [Cochleicola gelatinilyticus]OAB80114.1 hypothetical protein ULVI_05080 [Cochleicola gelatinilyticus]
MLKRLTIILIIVVFVSGLHAQKQMQKTWDASSFETLFIKSDAVYTITVISEKRNTISISTSIEGESSETVVVNASEINNTLTISTSRIPFFISKNDKLAAHKVLAIEMELKIPEDINFKVKSSMASVTLSGIFKEVSLALEAGNCIATKFKGNATIETKSGFITIEADDACEGIAISKYNTATNSLRTSGKYKIIATSIYGTVSLTQTK